MRLMIPNPFSLGISRTLNLNLKLNLDHEV